MHRSVEDVVGMKGAGRKISAVTSYDYTLAALCERAGIDVLLVGDSAGMVMLGHDDTTRVTMPEMCMFTGAVCRARKDALIVADMPFMSYQTGMRDAVRNAGRLVRAGADAVKLEGGSAISETVGAITDVGIPVMGHIGVQPQTATKTHGYRVRGTASGEALRLVEDARELEEAGAFAVVLEMVAGDVAGIITETLSIPTIGIGSGGGCDGQVLVAQDLLGMYEKVRPRFVKRYLELAGEIVGALERYRGDVSSGAFPEQGSTELMGAAELEMLRKRLREKIGR